MKDPGPRTVRHYDYCLTPPMTDDSGARSESQVVVAGQTEETVRPPPAPGGAGQTALGCLGVFCGLVAYWLTIGLADMMYAATTLPPLDPTGGLGMILGIGPPAWLAVLASVTMAFLKQGFLRTAGSGVVVALVSLLAAWLSLH